MFRSTDGRITVVSGAPGDDVRPGTYRALEANWNEGAGIMTRRYSLVIEGDSRGYSAHVPELPTILITGASIDELSTRAREAIQIYWENVWNDRSPTSLVREIEVELQA